MASYSSARGRLAGIDVLSFSDRHLLWQADSAFLFRLAVNKMQATYYGAYRSVEVAVQRGLGRVYAYLCMGR